MAGPTARTISVGLLIALVACKREPSAPASAAEPPAVPVPAAAPLQKAADEPARKPRGTCEDCRKHWCSSFEGVDLVAGCLKAPDPKLVPQSDPKFVADCAAVMRCAFEHACGYDPVRGPVHCYCGSRALDECKDSGPAADAPCVAEWQAATRSKTNIEVLLRFDQVQYPSGWAFHLLQCDRERCGATSPIGRCTP